MGRFRAKPNKVFFLLKELGLPYTITPVALAEIKQPEYLKVNPNGRIPAIEDPNTGIVLWESGAIVEYLIEKYDVENKLSFPAATEEYYHAKQWLFFQTTGQGPYFGQAIWFKKYHQENLPSALERYTKEINRVTEVLEGELAKSDWLVGNKFSYVDLSFISWYKAVSERIEEFNMDNYPHVKKWFDAIASRPAIKMVLNNEHK